MMFYLIAVALAFVQSSLLTALFQSLLIVPNLLLTYLFLNMLKGDYSMKKPLISGMLLDIFQNSLGLHTSGFLIFSLLFKLISSRYEFPTPASLTVVYGVLSLIEKLWVFGIFRVKFLIYINLPLLLASLLIEMLILYFISRRHLKNAET
jgi:hypothetical protein